LTDASKVAFDDVLDVRLPLISLTQNALQRLHRAFFQDCLESGRYLCAHVNQVIRTIVNLKLQKRDFAFSAVYQNTFGGEAICSGQAGMHVGKKAGRAGITAQPG
jgi:hypothetical protein